MQTTKDLQIFVWQRLRHRRHMQAVRSAEFESAEGKLFTKDGIYSMFEFFSLTWKHEMLYKTVRFIQVFSVLNLILIYVV